MERTVACFANRRGWWRLWFVLTLMWIAAVAIVVVSEWTTSFRLEQPVHLRRGAQAATTAGQVPSCIPFTVRLAANQPDPGQIKWDDLTAEPPGPWLRYQQIVRVRCIPKAPVLGASLAALLPPILLLLLAMAGVWIWRGFGQPRD